MNTGRKIMSKKLILTIGLVVIGSLIFITGCPAVDTPDPEITKNPPIKGNEATSKIKKVDFKNFAFPIEVDAKKGEEKLLSLKDGKLAKTKDAMGAELGKIQYADLTNDKNLEAIVNVGLTGEKDAKSNMVYVYALNDEDPKLLWNFETKAGEKVGLKEIKADNGKLLVEMFGDVKFNKGTFETVESKEKDKTTIIPLKWNEKGFEAVEGKPEVEKEEKTKAKTT